VGPGLITGAADDDPSAIATYSQAGALFGFGLAWTMLFTSPLMVVIQVIALGSVELQIAASPETSGSITAGDNNVAF
jgi:Mn2+/Fe2+ NRAMP family transporter